MKQLNFLLVVLLFCASSFSQVHFGIDPGLAISRGSFNSSVDYNRRIFAGFDGGVFLEIGVTPKFMIQPEVNYSIRGVELNNGDKEATIKLRYFDFPVLAKVAVCPKFNLYAGPQVSLLTWAKRDSSFTNEMIDLKNDFDKGDFGLVFGGEYNFNRHLFLGTRYYLGLHQIAEDWNNFEMKNRFISFRVGYKF
jgi:outer membrane protein with beta-barrel domain